jgi:hypothetical protein
VENPHYAFILVSDQKYWDRLCQRSLTGKDIHAFVRRNLVAPLGAQKLLFYVKKPCMQVRGVADFIERQTGDCTDLWMKHGSETCFESFEEYQAFAGGRLKVTFLRFRNLTALANPKPKEVTVGILGSLTWFRGRYVDEETAKRLTV